MTDVKNILNIGVQTKSNKKAIDKSTMAAPHTPASFLPSHIFVVAI